MTPKEILIKVKQEILTRGWCQKALTNELGNVCLIGAMTSYPLSKYDCTEAIELLKNTINPVLPPEALALWQDHPERTLEEVLELLDKAIELAE